MKYLLLVLALFSSLMAWAQQDVSATTPQFSKEEVIKSFTQLIASTPLSKQELIKIIDQMAQSKQISEKEAKEAKDALSKMSDDDMGQMKKTIIQMMTKQLQTMKLPSAKVP